MFRIIFAVVLILSFGIIIGKAQTEQELINKTEEISEEEIFNRYKKVVEHSFCGSEGRGGAIAGLEKLIKQYPKSVYSPLLQSRLDELYEEAAEYEFKVAMFWLKHDRRFSAESRLREIIEKYPNYSRFDEILYQLAVILYEDRRKDDVLNVLSKLVSSFPHGPRTSEAYVLLDSISTWN